MALAKRIIPCLDIAAGRVVKGVNFVNLRDAGDPVEVARRYDEQGADELAFLDITREQSTSAISSCDMIEAVADAGVHPAHRRRRRAQRRGHAALLNAGADKVSINTAGRAEPAARRRGGRRATARSASSSRSTRSASAPVDALGGLHARRPHARPGSTPSNGRAQDAGARRGRDPADQHGPRRHAQRLRPRADARGRRRGRRAGDRDRRRGQARSISSTACSTGRADAVLAATIFHYGEFTVRPGEGGAWRARGHRGRAL